MIKPGDRVICISPFNIVLVAGTYTVASVGAGYLYLEEVGGGWDIDRFVLEDTSPFELGEVDA